MEKKRAARYFLKDMVGIQLKTTDGMIPELEPQVLLYILCLSFVPQLFTYGLKQPIELRISSFLDCVCSSEAWSYSIVTVDTGLLHPGQWD